MNERANLSTNVTSAAMTFARWVANFDLDDVPRAIQSRAKFSILDALGIGLAASNYEFARVTADALIELGGHGDFPVIGTDLRLTRRDAAHLNGTIIHGLDFDDTHSEAVVHTSASTVPTMFIAGLASRASGRRALAAFIVGSECASRIGALARGGFHHKGFHPTGVVGAFGSTLAAGYLFDLDDEQLADAQGIVLSKAAGSLQFLDDGAWTKRSHPGWSSVCAQTAVAMAKHGFSGPREPYFGRYGLYPLHTCEGSDTNEIKLTDALGSRWEMQHIAFKPYPACHMTHAFADAALALKKQHGFALSEIERVVAFVHEQEIPVICEPHAVKIRPQSSYDAQFSVHYVIATALLRERFGLAELEDHALTDPEILALAAKVEFEPDPDSAYPDYFSGAVEIFTQDGQRFYHREQHNRGSADNPLSDQDLIDKYLDNATRRISTSAAESVMQIVLGLEHETSLEPLAQALTDTNLPLGEPPC